MTIADTNTHHPGRGNRLKYPSPYIGQKFGRWTVISEEFKVDGSRKRFVLCACECGAEKPQVVNSLNTGGTMSCGCYKRERSTIHGHTANVMRRKSAEYKAWSSMIERCTCPSNKSYPRYGGRGISVDASWMEFKKFYDDIGPRPSANHSLERIDNSKGYGPINCKWASIFEQNRNKRNNRVISAFGREQCLSAWAEETGLSGPVLIHRLDKMKWDAERALTTPLMRVRSNNHE